MPPVLERAYGGPLSIPLRPDAPTVIANFVSTIDGVVALDTEGATGGGEISGFYEPDRFVMGLLRTLADAVVIGAGSVRAAPTHRWTASHVHRASAAAFAAWRRDEGIADPEPTTIVVTRRGLVDPAHPGLADPQIPVVIATAPEGARNLAGADFGPNVRIVVDEGPDLSVVALRVAAEELGARVVLCEGGPHLFGELLGLRHVHELFLTLAPQMVGRDPDVQRFGLVEGRAFDRADAPWSDLASVTRSSDHLFLRYRIRAGATAPRP
jgi:riboflavin biosynthesis pyrimidine reductase